MLRGALAVVGAGGAILVAVGVAGTVTTGVVLDAAVVVAGLSVGAAAVDAIVAVLVARALAGAVVVAAGGDLAGAVVARFAAGALAVGGAQGAVLALGITASVAAAGRFDTGAVLADLLPRALAIGGTRGAVLPVAGLAVVVAAAARGILALGVDAELARGARAILQTIGAVLAAIGVAGPVATGFGFLLAAGGPEVTRLSCGAGAIRRAARAILSDHAGPIATRRQAVVVATLCVTAFGSAVLGLFGLGAAAVQPEHMPVGADLLGIRRADLLATPAKAQVALLFLCAMLVFLAVFDALFGDGVAVGPLGTIQIPLTALAGGAGWKCGCGTHHDEQPQQRTHGEKTSHAQKLLHPSTSWSCSCKRTGATGSDGHRTKAKKVA